MTVKECFKLILKIAIELHSLPLILKKQTIKS